MCVGEQHVCAGLRKPLDALDVSELGSPHDRRPPLPVDDIRMRAERQQVLDHRVVVGDGGRRQHRLAARHVGVVDEVRDAVLRQLRDLRPVFLSHAVQQLADLQRLEAREGLRHRGRRGLLRRRGRRQAGHSHHYSQETYCVTNNCLVTVGYFLNMASDRPSVFCLAPFIYCTRKLRYLSFMHYYQS